MEVLVKKRPRPESQRKNHEYGLVSLTTYAVIAFMVGEAIFRMKTMWN